jgi:hypothetical protein
LKLEVIPALPDPEYPVTPVDGEKTVTFLPEGVYF